jgi:hypothetical protein
MFPREDRDHLRQCPLCTCPCGNLTVLLWREEPRCPTCYRRERETPPRLPNATNPLSDNVL